MATETPEPQGTNNHCETVKSLVLQLSNHLKRESGSRIVEVPDYDGVLVGFQCEKTGETWTIKEKDTKETNPKTGKFKIPKSRPERSFWLAGLAKRGGKLIDEESANETTSNSKVATGKGRAKVLQALRRIKGVCRNKSRRNKKRS